LVTWERLFTLSGTIDWRDAPRASDQEDYDNARGALVKQSLKLVTEVLFSKNYFSLEETGLGYACPPLGQRSAEEHDRLSAFLRVFGDAYRFVDSPWTRRSAARDWRTLADVPAKSRVRRLAQRLWPDEEPCRAGVEGVWRGLDDCGHEQGLISPSRVCVMLVGEGASYWRCTNCSRAHLHRGVGLCTRCFVPLPQAATGAVKELRRHSFLARRVERPG